LENFEMKKTLVAVAALAAFSGAYAEVTISGLLDAAFTIDGSNSTLGEGPNGGSEFTLNLKEDLGNGVSAIGALNVIGSVVNNTGFRQYNSFVGLQGEFGSLKLGTQWNPVFLASTISDATGRWGSTNLANPAELQVSNSLTYTSPSMSGVSISFQKQLRGATADGGANNLTALVAPGVDASTSGSSQAYSLNYSAGAFNAAYANSADDTLGKSTLIAASYNFGVATAHYGNLRTDHAALGTNVTTNSLGVSAPIGALTLSAIYSSGTDTSATNYQAVYALSKRTAVYLNQAKAANGTNSSFAGVKHAF